MLFEKKNVLFVTWSEMPPLVKAEIADWNRFNNDCALPLITSYRLGDGPQTPEHMLKESSLRWLYDLVVIDEKYKGSFEDFLKSYGLLTYHWLATSGQNFAGVDDVYIDVCW